MITRAFLIISLFLTPNAVFSATHFSDSSIYFERFSHIHELNSYSITDIYQDHKGIIWIATINGLNRFDGYEVLTDRVGILNEIPALHVNEMVEDQYQNLWMLDRLYQRIFYLNKNRTEYFEASIPDEEIKALEFDGENIWIFSNRAAFRWDRQRNQFQEYHLQFDNSKCIYFSGEGFMMISSPQDIRRYDRIADEFLIADDTDNVAEVVLLGLISESFEKEKLTLNECIELEKVNDDNYWIASSNHGIFSYGKIDSGDAWSSENLRVERYRHIPFLEHSLVSDGLSSILRDKEGTVWIGSKEQGINIYSSHRNKFKKITHVYADDGWREIRTVRALAEGKDGDVFIGTQENGLIIVDEDFRFKKEITKLPSLTIRSLHVSGNDVLWVGHYEGLSSIDLRTFEVKNHHLEKYRRVLKYLRAYDIKEDKDNNLWVSLWNTLIMYNPETGQSQEIKLLEDEEAHINIRCFEFDKSGILWVGTENFGLIRYNPRTGSKKVLDRRAGQLPSKNIFNIKHNNGILNISTSAGLIFYDIANDHFFFPGTDDKVYRKRTYAALNDDRGGIWVSTVNGMWYYNTITDSVKAFDTSDGLLSNEFTKNGLLKKRNGEIVFGSISGITAFYPSEISVPDIRPEILIGDGYTGEKSHLIDLDYDQRSFEIKANVISYLAPQKNVLAYRLKGWEESWHIQSASDPRIFYENLPEGSFELQIKAYLRDTPNQYSSYSIPVSRAYPFWKSWWFLLLSALVFSGIVYLIYRLNVFYIERDRDLKLKVYEAEIKVLKSQISPHFLLNTLNNIYSLCMLDPQKAGKIVLSLSQMMRYMLYESSQDKVLLENEIIFLENYIRLIREKNPESDNLKFNIQGSVGRQTIVPFMLISFVENSFKHGDLFRNPKGYVNIDLEITEKKLFANIQNTYYNINQLNESNEGIGLNNVKKRLDLFYPRQYSLDIVSRDNIFSVYLMILIA